jgi:OmpR-family two-component system manganese-sensing response regulator
MTQGPQMLDKSQSKGRILFVNDDPDTYDLVAFSLKEIGYETVVALNITTGLEMAQSQRFDLILIDWFFEDGTGLDLCRNIRLVDNLTPIFFYTAECRKTEIKKALQAGAQGCFLKPVDIDSFLKTLSQQIIQQRNQSNYEH